MTAVDIPDVLGLCGSLREGSYTHRALKIALAAAQRAGAATGLLAGAALRLPLCDGRPPAAYPPEVLDLRERARRADALLLASPEYCGTLSAVLKNALEWLSPDILRGKLIGVLAVAEGPSATGALQALQQIGWAQGAWVLPVAASAPLAPHLFLHPDSALAHQVRCQLEQLGAALPEAVCRLRREGKQ